MPKFELPERASLEYLKKLAKQRLAQLRTDNPGANVNVRDENGAYALHWAAGNADVESVKTLLDAGGDVHGAGDCYGLDVIGWALLTGPQHHESLRRRAAVTSLLLERGARHHIYSAICAGDTTLARQVVHADAEALQRRLVNLEAGASPVSGPSSAASTACWQCSSNWALTSKLKTRTAALH